MKMAVVNAALVRALRVFLLMSAISTAFGLVGASVSFTHRGHTDFSVLYPELPRHDSATVESRGFPFPQWATNPQSFRGEARTAFLPSGIAANVAFYYVLAFLVIPPIWLLVRLARYIDRRDARRRALADVH